VRMSRPPFSLFTGVLWSLFAHIALAGTIKELSTSNFSRVLEQAPLAFVNFYSTTCIHSASLEPEFFSTAQVFSKTR